MLFQNNKDVKIEIDKEDYDQKFQIVVYGLKGRVRIGQKTFDVFEKAIDVPEKYKGFAFCFPKGESHIVLERVVLDPSKKRHYAVLIETLNS